MMEHLHVLNNAVGRIDTGYIIYSKGYTFTTINVQAMHIYALFRFAVESILKYML